MRSLLNYWLGKKGKVGIFCAFAKEGCFYHKLLKVFSWLLSLLLSLWPLAGSAAWNTLGDCRNTKLWKSYPTLHGTQSAGKSGSFRAAAKSGLTNAARRHPEKKKKTPWTLKQRTLLMCLNSLLYKCFNTVARRPLFLVRIECVCVCVGWGRIWGHLHAACWIFVHINMDRFVQTDTKLGSSPGHMVVSFVCPFAEILQLFFKFSLR